MTRRAVLAGLAAAAAGVALWRSPLFGAAPFSFEAMAQPRGFRQFKSGPVSATGAVFAGLGAPASSVQQSARDTVAQNLCDTLFEPAALGTVPVAYFYDYQCPICRRLTPRLRDLSGVNLTWHDLSGLGPASETAARAAIAARKQGAFDAFHDRMMRAAFQPNEGYVAALADSIGINSAQLLADMQSPDVTRRMDISQALADVFAMPGTPGLVVGRTLVIGDVDSATLNRLIAIEASDPGPCS